MKKTLLISSLLVILGFGAIAQPANDNKVNATLISSTTSFVSADAAYSNESATPDGLTEGCVYPQRNVWFKFQASTNEIEIKLLMGGAKGSITYPALSLFDAAGNQVVCSWPNGRAPFIQNMAMTVGSWYYFSVDNYAGISGTFSLEVRNSIGYDLKAKAELISNTTSFVSADAAYSTKSATPDGLTEGCVYPQRNVWFKFQASTNEIEIKLLMGGAKGSITYPALSLFDAAGNQVVCSWPNGGAPFIQNTAMTVGSWYYFSVDNYAGDAGTFTISLTNNIGYDLKAKAEVITHSANWVSSDGQYSNAEATPDDNGSTCFSGVVKNVWFRFQATTSEVEVKVLTGGSKGTILYTVASLFDNNGTSLSCNKTDAYNASTIQYTALTVGNWYFISVDNYAGAYHAGTFTLQLKNAVGFDLKAKALFLTNLSGWTSPDGAYSNLEATPDAHGSTCFGGPVKNVWFKFKATTPEIKVKLLTGSTKGSIQYTVLSLFDNNSNEISCDKTDAYASPMVQGNSLVPGQTYYISVDNFAGSYHSGTFALQINDQVGNDLKTTATLIDHVVQWCSADAQFSNEDALADEVNDSTCSSTFSHNVWFKFQATSSHAIINLQTGGTKGTLTNPAVYLIESNGQSVSCITSTGSQPIILENATLTKGTWYYISVDSQNGILGTFTLCLEGGLAASLCENIFCDENGVGIGTPLVATGYRLSVNGKIMAEGVKVELQSKWPDFVFEKDHELLGITEVDKYIQDNGHLPEMPSAEQVAVNGIDLGTMDAKLLQKIEELTLYVIAISKEVKEVKKENVVLKDEVRKMKANR